MFYSARERIDLSFFSKKRGCREWGTSKWEAMKSSSSLLYFSKTEKFITEKNQLDKENWNRKIFILDKNCSEKKMFYEFFLCCLLLLLFAALIHPT